MQNILCGHVDISLFLLDIHINIVCIYVCLIYMIYIYIYIYVGARVSRHRLLVKCEGRKLKNPNSAKGVAPGLQFVVSLYKYIFVVDNNKKNMYIYIYISSRRVFKLFAEYGKPDEDLRRFRRGVMCKCDGSSSNREITCM